MTLTVKPITQLQAHAFHPADLVAGHPALDFVNTVTARDTEPRDWLDDYGALLRWAGQGGLVDPLALSGLEGIALRAPREADDALARARSLREALCAVLYAFIGATPADPRAVAVLDRARLAASGAAALVATPHRLQAQWTVEASGLDLIAHVVTAHAVDLLRDPTIDRLRVCDGRHCGWVFLDTSKNGRRRWCDMSTCGNVAKARRFQARQRPDAASA